MSNYKLNLSLLTKKSHLSHLTSKNSLINTQRDF